MDIDERNRLLSKFRRNPLSCKSKNKNTQWDKVANPKTLDDFMEGEK